MNALAPIREVALAEIDGTPLVQDLELAERLGFKRPRAIRELIERNRVELEAYGSLAVRHGKSRGQTFTEHWLTEEQALLLATLSNAPNAPAVRAMLIKVFVAWRRGHLQGFSLPTTLQEVMERTFGIAKMLSHKVTMLEGAVARIERAAGIVDPEAAVAADYKTPLRVLVEAGVLPKGRRPLSQRVSKLLAKASAELGVPVKRTFQGGPLFHVSVIAAWMAAGGAALIADHKATVAGQGRLPFDKGPL